jgi:hypothetical protein
MRVGRVFKSEAVRAHCGAFCVGLWRARFQVMLSNMAVASSETFARG